MKRTLITMILAYLALSTVCVAEVPEYTAKRAVGKIVVDGVLDEADWAAAEPSGDFVFPWWSAGEKEQTKVKILWDDTYLYIAYSCRDAHIWAEYYNINDATYNDDCVELFWNPSPAEQEDYYMFEINCIGNLKSMKKSDRSTIMLPHIAQTIQGTVNDDSDTDSGWTMEIALRFDEYPELLGAASAKDGDLWRIGLNRCGGKTNPQYSQWAPSDYPTPNFHRPDDFGKLIFSAETVR